MSSYNPKYVLPTCAVVASLFGVANIRYSLGLFFQTYGKQTDVLPGLVRFAWGIHDFRWLILILGTGSLMVVCRRARTEVEANLFSGFYMLGWFALCFLVQLCLIIGLNNR